MSGKQHPQRLLILGATSAIAQATARCFADRGAEFFLVARHESKLQAVAADLRVRTKGRVEHLDGDLTNIAFQKSVIAAADASLGGIDVAFIAWGDLGDHAAAIADPHAAEAVMFTNFNSVVGCLTELGNYFGKRGNGSIVCISSVAGERGRQSNYVYGAAKAGLTAFLQGLRNRLASQNIQVLTVLPGFVDTPMTAGMKKGPLYVAPSVVGQQIYRAVICRRDVIYTPKFWRLIMLVIKLIPERIFKKLKL